MSDERGGRYFREARFFLAGDKVAARSHILEARSLLGYMRDQHSLGGPPIQVKYATLNDGTQIKAVMMNGQYQAEIVSPPSVLPERKYSPIIFAEGGGSYPSPRKIYRQDIDTFDEVPFFPIREKYWHNGFDRVVSYTDYSGWGLSIPARTDVFVVNNVEYVTKSAIRAGFAALSGDRVIFGTPPEDWAVGGLDGVYFYAVANGGYAYMIGAYTLETGGHVLGSSQARPEFNAAGTKCVLFGGNDSSPNPAAYRAVIGTVAPNESYVGLGITFEITEHVVGGAINNDVYSLGFYSDDSIAAVWRDSTTDQWVLNGAYLAPTSSMRWSDARAGVYVFEAYPGGSTRRVLLATRNGVTELVPHIDGVSALWVFGAAVGSVAMIRVIAEGAPSRSYLFRVDVSAAGDGVTDLTAREGIIAYPCLAIDPAFT